MARAACTDGDDDQWLVGITDDGRTFPFALNPAGREPRACGMSFNGAAVRKQRSVLRKPRARANRARASMGPPFENSGVAFSQS